ncbi:MAG: cell wall-binding repeat-containing protein [Finegoldia sp.]|nr:cell wall-binding repeat-containing protein [Finegoldia sp.]
MKKRTKSLILASLILSQSFYASVLAADQPTDSLNTVVATDSGNKKEPVSDKETSKDSDLPKDFGYNIVVTPIESGKKEPEINVPKDFDYNIVVRPVGSDKEEGKQPVDGVSLPEDFDYNIVVTPVESDKKEPEINVPKDFDYEIFVKPVDTNKEVKIQSKRIAGANRYETAIEISKKGFKTADTVIVATGENYADALAAASLAGVQKAPILLTNQGQTDLISKEIKRLGAKNIIIVGGEKAVSKAEAEAYAKLGKVERVAGANRYQTALKIAEKVLAKTNRNVVIVADGQNYPDALAVGAYAAKEGLPIILADGDDLPYAKDLIAKNKISRGIIVGGKVAVGDVEGYFKQTKRIAGANRYQTAIEVAKNLFKDTKEVNLVSGENYPDALAVGVLAGKTNTPVILNPAKGTNEDVEKYLKENKIEKVNIFGGKVAIERDF